jgi:hypothetical protein
MEPGETYHLHTAMALKPGIYFADVIFIGIKPGVSSLKYFYL